METVDQGCIEDDRLREKGGITMKTLLRVFVLVTAFMVVGSGAMAAELLFAYRATTMDGSDVEMGTFFPGDTLKILILVDNAYDVVTYGELKFALKGKGVSAKDWWQDIEFDTQGVWNVGYEFLVDLVEIPEGVYNVTFKFREMVKGAKWQKLICRFQIIDTTNSFQRTEASPKTYKTLQLKRTLKQ
jgi:hypothetical protein